MDFVDSHSRGQICYVVGWRESRSRREVKGGRLQEDARGSEDLTTFRKRCPIHEWDP